MTYQHEQREVDPVQRALVDGAVHAPWQVRLRDRLRLRGWPCEGFARVNGRWHAVLHDGHRLDPTARQCLSIQYYSVDLTTVLRGLQEYKEAGHD